MAVSVISFNMDQIYLTTFSADEIIQQVGFCVEVLVLNTQLSHASVLLCPWPCILAAVYDVKVWVSGHFVHQGMNSETHRVMSLEKGKDVRGSCHWPDSLPRSITDHEGSGRLCLFINMQYNCHKNVHLCLFFVHIHLHLLSKYVGLELLSHMTSTCLILYATLIWFSL